MSENENVKGAKKIIDNFLGTLSSLKESNPKVLYGGVAVLVIIILFMMMSGGGSKTGSVAASAVNLSIGKNYVLKVPNAYDNTATVRLVGAPGSMAAYDDTDKADREGCKHLPQGTTVELKEFFAAYGNDRAFSKVIVSSGECKGTIGWTLSINLSDK